MSSAEPCGDDIICSNACRSGTSISDTIVALSFGVALLHLGIVAGGPPAYRYFGAGDLAPLAERGSPVPALLTLGLAGVFGAWGLYALAGAGVVRRPPLLAPGLLAIGGIYTARGLAVVPELADLARGASAVPARYAGFSAVALAIGLVYLVGTARAWRALRARRPRAP